MTGAASGVLTQVSFVADTHTHTHARTHTRTQGVPVPPGLGRTHRHHHGVLSVEFGDEFVSAASLRVVQRPEAAHHLHPAHPALHRVRHHRTVRR